MFHRPLVLSALFAGTALLASGCSVAPPLNAQETQIQTDLSVDQYMPATRQMRDAIETQELFAQAAFWSNEYNLNPGDLEAALKLSAAVRKMGNPGRAVEITQTTRALYPSDPYLMAEYAAALIASERALDAMPILNEGLSKTPSYGRLWSLKGAALDQQERYAEARQHYDRALRISPNDPNVMANMGLSHALAGDPATAEQWLRRAASMPNASNSVRQNLILVLQLQGKTAEADKLAGMTRPQMSFPKTRPAFNPALPTKPTSLRSSNPTRTGQPQARMQMGPAQGQQFSSASEAARAMATKRGIRTAPQPQTQNNGYLQQQPTPVQPQQAPQGYSSQGYYPQTQTATGTSTPSQPKRREPNRRRR